MKRIAIRTIESDLVRVLVTWGLLFACLFSIIMYAYSVNKAIFEAVSARNISSKIGELNTRLSALQTQYLSLQNEATLSKAAQLGLAETDARRFISRKALGQGLSLRDEI